MRLPSTASLRLADYSQVDILGFGTNPSTLERERALRGRCRNVVRSLLWREGRHPSYPWCPFPPRRARPGPGRHTLSRGDAGCCGTNLPTLEMSILELEWGRCRRRGAFAGFPTSLQTGGLFTSGHSGAAVQICQFCQFKNNYFTEMCSGFEAGSYLRTIDFCITQL